MRTPGLVFLLLPLAVATCAGPQSATPPVAAAPAPTPPATSILQVVPAACRLVALAPNLPLALADMEAWSERLTAGTGLGGVHAITGGVAQTLGFDPALAETWQRVGLDPDAGAVFVAPTVGGEGAVGLGVADPQRLGAALDAWARRLGGHPAGGSGGGGPAGAYNGGRLAPAGLIWRRGGRFIFLGREAAGGLVAALAERAASAQPPADGLADDAEAMAARGRLHRGVVDLWMRPPTGGAGRAGWSAASAVFDHNGMLWETFQPPAADGETAQPAGRLQALLGRIDADALGLMALAYALPADVGDHLADGAADGALGLRLREDILPQLGGAATAAVFPGEDGAALDANAWAASASLDIVDPGAAAALLDRVHKHLVGRGTAVSRRSRVLAGERVVVFEARPEVAPSAVGGQRAGILVRWGLWRKTLVAAVGEGRLADIAAHLAGRPSALAGALAEGPAGPRLPDSQMIFALRLGRLAAEIDRRLASTPQAAPMRQVAAPYLTIMRRIGDLVMTARAIPEGHLGAVEQRLVEGQAPAGTVAEPDQSL